MKNCSFCRKLTVAKNTVIFTVQVAAALCLTVPAVIAFAAILHGLSGGNIKEK